MRFPASGAVPRRLLLRLQALALLSALPSAAVTDITFFAVSDTHYGRVMGATYDSLRIVTVDNLNALPGQAYPASVGGALVAAPRGVVMPGDLVDRPYATRWKLYTDDYGAAGEGRMKFAVYDGLGNHDVYNYGINDTTSTISKLFIARNAKRKGIRNADAKRLHYSWDWDQVHFVQLNLFAGYETGALKQWDPNGSMAFLKADLEKYVGKSGRPVLVAQHFAVDTSQADYQNTQKDSMVALLKLYNCIGILHGHTHAEGIYKYKGLDIFSDGAAFKGDIMVFRITDGKMFVVNRVGSSWGRLKFEKTITMGNPVTGLRDRGAPAAAGPGEFLFHVAGVGRVFAANVRALRVDIIDPSGRVIRHLAAVGREAEWNGMDDRGARVRSGMYLVRIETGAGRKGLKVLLP